MANYTTTGSDTFPAGHVVRTSVVQDPDVASHVMSNANQTATASGILISTPAVSGSNYNRITWSSGGYTPANKFQVFYLYANKNGAGYARAVGADNQSNGQHWYYENHRQFNCSWIDTGANGSITAGTNIYQIYFETPNVNFYLVHSGNDYNLTVQEIKV